MITYKCKMCGGDLRPEENAAICECEFCGTVQTVPAADSEKKAQLFNRANRLRMNAEFDKAAAVYESIAAEEAAEKRQWKQNRQRKKCLAKRSLNHAEMWEAALFFR